MSDGTLRITLAHGNYVASAMPQLGAAKKTVWTVYVNCAGQKSKMQAQPGSTVTWRKPNGRVATMRVDWVHETEEARWLFSAVSPGGGFTAVNSKWVLKVS